MSIVLYINRPAPFAWDVAAAIFGASGVGGFYDASDLSTVFQVAAGTIPSLPGDPVGLMLDKRLGLVLGPDLMAQSGWQSTTTPAWDVSVPGQASIISAAGQADLRPAENSGNSFTPAVMGRRYLIEFDYEVSASSIIIYPLSGAPSPNLTGSGTYRSRAIATASTFLIRADTGATATVTNWRVRELPGNHLSQPTASARPTLARMPLTGRRNLLRWTEEFDNAAWTKTSCTVTDMGDGVFRLQAAAGSWILRQSVATNGLNCAMAFDVKSNGAGLDDAQLIMSGVRLQPFSATPEWQRVNVVGLHNNNSASNGIHHLGGEAIDILVRFPQLEYGTEPTPYQRVTNAFDVTEEGVPDTYSLVYDLADDALTTVLPQAINGDILIAGTKGSIIEPVNYAASSTFTLGPDTYTGGTPGILSAIGDIVGVLLIDRTLTQAERDTLVEYYKGKGAKGLLVPGPELLVNGDFSDGLNEWTNSSTGTATVNLVGQNVVMTGMDGSNRSILNRTITSLLTSGANYLVSVGVVSVGPEGFQGGVGPGVGNASRASINFSAYGVVSSVFQVTGSTNILWLRSHLVGGSAEISYASVRELRAEEDWT